jgi:predicted nucleic acid-binding protein
MKEPNRLPEPDAFGASISSELIRLEFTRVVRRYQIEKRLKLEDANELLDLAEVWLGKVDILPIFPAILARASVAFPTVVSTLDSIHLATALLWQEDTGERLTFLTHDRQLRTAAQACGFATSTA